MKKITGASFNCRFTACLAASLTLLCHQAGAVDYYYSWIGTSGAWSDPVNWNPSVPQYHVPGGDYYHAHLQFSDAVDRVIDGVGPAQSINIGNDGGGTVYWNISEGHNYAGDSGFGVHFWAGTVLTISGGSLDSDLPGSFVLDAGATINQTGGFLGGSTFIRIDGIYNLGGSGSIGDAGYGFSNTGTINQTGGRLYATGTMGNSGIFNLSDGEFHGHVFNTGEFNLLGGQARTLSSAYNAGLINATGSTTFSWIAGLDIVGDTVTDIHGDSDAIVFYDPAQEYSAYLNGLTYNLQGGGYLMPIPEPSPVSILLVLAAGLAHPRLRRRNHSF